MKVPQGRVAATIAHEINNPLEATTNLLYLIETSEGLPENAQQNAKAADAEGSLDVRKPPMRSSEA
jgi:C4-dicarboxylate-specific signal transduction histidine kinase